MKKYLFIDCDGTLVCEPEDYQVDDLSKVVFFPRVFPALFKEWALPWLCSQLKWLRHRLFTFKHLYPVEHIVNTFHSQGPSI